MSRPKTKDARLNIRIPNDLFEWVKKYVARRDPPVTITDLVTENLKKLRETDPDAGQ